MQFQPPFSKIDQLLENYSPQRVKSDAKAKVAFSPNLRHLHAELTCPVLDELDSYIHFFTRKSREHISPLHKHILFKRQIIIAEDPGLHLAWDKSDIYLKPVPEVLLNHQFWQDCLCPRSPSDPGNQEYFDGTIYLKGAAIGFLRSYAHLIHHKYDFNIAKTHNLIPSNIEYDNFQQFIGNFRSRSDSKVSPRWLCGQIRLSRLNWAVRLCRPVSRQGAGFLANVFYLAPTHWQCGNIFDFITAPAITLFGIFSFALSAMQIVLATQKGQTCEAFVRVSWGFSIAVLVVVVALVGALTIILGILWLTQILFALTYRKAGVSRHKR